MRRRLWWIAGAAVLVPCLVAGVLFIRGRTPRRPRLESAMRAAIDRGDPEAVEALLERGAPVNVRGTRGQTALMSTGSHRLGLMRRLLAAGADTNIQATNGATALHWAALDGDPEEIRLLLDHG